MRIALAILNRNEGAALPVILPQLPLSDFEVVVAIDGNSTDGSPNIIREHGIGVVTQTASGRGEAFRLAYEHLGENVDAILFFSPDGNEDPADTLRFRNALENGADMVIASRMMPESVNEEDHGWLRPRKWANIAFNWLAYLTWGRGQPRITDGINGFRAITTSAWNQLNLDGDGYTIEYQSTIRAYKLGLAVSEFPTAEGQRIGGESNAKAIDTGIRFLRLYWRELSKKN